MAVSKQHNVLFGLFRVHCNEVYKRLDIIILYEENTVHIYYSKDGINAVFTLPNGINITHAYMVKVANAAKVVFGYYYNLHHICRTNDESETVVKTVQDITPDVVKYMRYIEDKANGRYHGYCR